MSFPRPPCTKLPTSFATPSPQRCHNPKIIPLRVDQTILHDFHRDGRWWPVGDSKNLYKIAGEHRYNKMLSSVFGRAVKKLGRRRRRRRNAKEKRKRKVGAGLQEGSQQPRTSWWGEAFSPARWCRDNSAAKCRVCPVAPPLVHSALVSATSTRTVIVRSCTHAFLPWSCVIRHRVCCNSDNKR